MAAYLGHEVRDELRRRGSATGPIVSYPRSRSWVFLVRPDLPDSAAVFAQLYRAGVTVYGHGRTIALPSPSDRPPAVRHWVEPPRDGFRPSAMVVVAAISRCLPPRAINLSALGSPEFSTRARGVR
jgi:hypothetical protein